MRPADAPCQNPHTIAICTTGRSPSGTLCFFFHIENNELCLWKNRAVSRHQHRTERRRHLQRPWNRERFGRDGAVRCGLRHLFCHQLHPELHRPLDAGPAEEGTGLCPGKGRIKLKFSFISPFLPIPDLLHRKPVPGQLKRLPGAGFLPPFRGLFVSGRQRFLKRCQTAKKVTIFSSKKAVSH